ncbi:MAG: pilus assembly protein PilM [Dehalococcoidaceae bacterium]|nr:pilus assembly protein PilM [Dehalococcoidaceae bacterium]
MAKKKISLYIEDTEIKLLESHGSKIDKWASFTLEPSLVRDGVILDENRVAEAIKELMHLNKISEKKVTVGLSGLNSIFRITSLPELPTKLLPEAIINEASRIIPMPLEEVYLSHQVISIGQGEIRLFLAAYPRSSTDTLMRTLAKAGLKTSVIELAPIALARCVDAPKAIIINSWLSNLDIVILNERLPQVVRSISLSGDEMSNEDKVSAIIEEFNRTVSFYNSNRKDNPLNTSVPVFACGDLIKDEALWQAFNLNLMDYNISSITPPVESPEAFIPCEYMVNIGLAIKDILPKGDGTNYSVIGFNALPEAYLPPSFSWYRILVPVVTVSAIGGLIYFWLVIQNIGTDTARLDSETAVLSAQITQLQSQLVPLRTSIAEQKALIEPLPEQIAQIETEIAATENLTGIFDQTSAVLEESLEAINLDFPETYNLQPEGVFVSKITSQGDSFSIEGIATTENGVYDYARALRESERFTAVSVNNIIETVSASEEDEEVVQYNFEITVH